LSLRDAADADWPCLQGLFQTIDSMKPIVSSHERWPLAPSPRLRGWGGVGHSGIADLSAASSTEASAKAEASGDGVCVFPHPNPPPPCEAKLRWAGEGAQQCKRRDDSNADLAKTAVDSRRWTRCMP
jgi:hypothetical protein